MNDHHDQAQGSGADADRWAHTEKLLMDERVLRLTAEGRLAQAIDLLSSAFQIAERAGKDTNWDAFKGSLLRVLHANNRNGNTPRTYRKPTT